MWRPSSTEPTGVVVDHALHRHAGRGLGLAEQLGLLGADQAGADGLVRDGEGDALGAQGGVETALAQLLLRRAGTGRAGSSS